MITHEGACKLPWIDIFFKCWKISASIPLRRVNMGVFEFFLKENFKKITQGVKQHNLATLTWKVEKNLKN